ncbi:MAG: MOSC domain-containing protein [Burkholderiaceae bacterium]|nr:MOSC domain-containing protein [Burkholderiaceae bacterium]
MKLPAPDALLTVHHINVGSARALRVGERKVLSAIGKTALAGPVAVGRLGLAGDEQADLSVHGGLDKAVYAYPASHYAFWREQRRARGVSLFDEDLPPGFLGENLTVEGLLEDAVYVGDTLHFPDCVLRVTAPREPCAKFNAVMGFAQAGRAMALAGCCGYYLAVEQPGTLTAGQQARLVPGQRGLSIAQAFAGKFAKHAR